MCVKQSEQAVESEERLETCPLKLCAVTWRGESLKTQKTRKTSFERLWHAYCYHLSVLFTQYLRGANC